MDDVFNLSFFVWQQTGHYWFEHAGANEIMRLAVDLVIKSSGGEGEKAFDPTRVPRARIVESDNPKTVAVGLVVGLRNWRAPSPGRRWKLEQMYPPIRAARRATEEE